MDGLNSNSVYTLWWIIFNDPEECNSSDVPPLCGLGDLNPDRDGPGVNPVDRGVRNAAAFISSPSGTGNTTAELEEGPAPVGAAGFGQLNDSVGAEIHIIIQTHGRPLVGSVAQQMTIPGAACNKKCADQFAIVFLLSELLSIRAAEYRLSLWTADRCQIVLRRRPSVFGSDRPIDLVAPPADSQSCRRCCDSSRMHSHAHICHL